MLIVVCPNTVVSKLVFDWIAGREAELPDGAKRLVPGNLALLSNVEDGTWTTRQRTILIDSEQLESGEPLGADFRKDAAREIEAFKQAYRLRNPGADVDKLTDADLLREAMNTIGKKGKLGEHIRCVVSVAMLTEGWDANTVTHILGVRPFRSQLLCEQVVGRGLRRRSYAVNPDTGCFEPEYAEVYGVPFAFIPGDRPIPKPQALGRPSRCGRCQSAGDLAIRFPKLDGYRVELPDEDLHADFDETSSFTSTRATVALWVEEPGRRRASQKSTSRTSATLAPSGSPSHIAKTLMQRRGVLRGAATAPSARGCSRSWSSICRPLARRCVTADDGRHQGAPAPDPGRRSAAEKVFGSIVRYPENSVATLLMPIIRRFDSMGPPMRSASSPARS